MFGNCIPTVLTILGWVGALALAAGIIMIIAGNKKDKPIEKDPEPVDVILGKFHSEI